MFDHSAVDTGGAARAAWAQLAAASAAVAAQAGSMWQLTAAELREVLAADHVAAAQRDAARLAVLRDVDARGLAAEQGYASTQAWLSHELLIDRPKAAADVRAARQLDPLGDVPPAPGALTSQLERGEVQLAATGRALLAGEVSRAHVDAVTAVVRALPQQGSVAEQADLHARAEGLLLTECARLTPEQVRRCGAHIRHHLDPDGVLADERDAVARSTFTIKPDRDGPGYSFHGTTDAVTGAQLVTLIDAHSKPQPVLNPETGVLERDPRLPITRRGHAFADLVRLASGADTTVSGGLPTQLIVTIALASLQAQLGERGVACGLTEDGRALTAATIRKMACDASIIPTVLGSNSEPLDIGRATRTIPVGIRRALTVRDGHCAFPGCDRPPRWADAHHIRHWADGGPTSLDNLVTLCGHHHDVIHHTGWTVTIEAGLPTFRAPAIAGRSRGRPPQVAA